MSTPKKSVTVNESMRLYVLRTQGGFSCLGFDVCEARINRYAAWLADRGLTPENSDPPGTVGRYEFYCSLCESIRKTGERCDADLCDQLRGKEGCRVEVVDRHGDRRRFYVGKSGGFIPIHLEIARRDSSGGGGVTGAPFRSVKVLY